MATAQATTTSTGSSTNSALSWMNVRDSSGVPLSSYVFATDRGSLWNPGNTAISLVLNLEFAGWLVMVTTAVWLIGYALSFRWLDMFAEALHSFSESLVRQIATPQMLLTAAAIGAFFVAWFIVRGYHAKAAIQVLTMLMVAVLGPLFLASPLEDVLSSDGLLAQGRNVGISVAAGLNGDNNPNPNQLVATMQEDLADNFARRPLQVWNFGHIIDDRVSCAAAWTAGAGNEDRVRKGMKDCQDDYAHWATEHPSVGQIGAGLLLLISGIVLLAFAVVLAVKVIWAALDTIYHSIMAVFGFAAGGFIYGVTQTFLVRNLVDAFVSAARMAIFTIFLGLYVLFLGGLFRQADGQVMAVFVIGAIVEIIAILQLRRLSDGINKGNVWIANRFSLALHGPGKGGGGGGGGTAIGMGGVGTKRTMGAGALTALGALATVGSSPLTEWVAGKTRSPFRPYARMEKKALRNSLQYSSQPWHADANAQSIMKFVQFSTGARKAAEQWGGVNTYRGAAAALQGLHDSGGSIDAAWGALTGAGFTDETLMHNAIVSWKRASDDAEDETLQYKHLGHVVSAMQHAQRSAHRLENGLGSAEEAAADLATLHESAWRFQRANDNYVTLDGGAVDGPQRRFVRDYLRDPSKAKLEALNNLADGSAAGSGLLAGIQPADAQRMRNAIGNRHASNVQTAVTRLLDNPTDRENFRLARREIGSALNTDMWGTTKTPTPWHSIAPPQSGARVGSYNAAMSAVNDLLNG
ncbi:hypothetical protein [Nocardia sp. NPDC057440]|uniref:hypothetical protein n=1 Tax=Nocardia sp. NPDC057440 TaxID=3346134 RepID=UPI00366C5C08